MLQPNGFLHSEFLSIDTFTKDISRVLFKDRIGRSELTWVGFVSLKSSFCCQADQHLIGFTGVIIKNALACNRGEKLLYLGFSVTVLPLGDRSAT